MVRMNTHCDEDDVGAFYLCVECWCLGDSDCNQQKDRMRVLRKRFSMARDVAYLLKTTLVVMIGHW